MTEAAATTPANNQNGKLPPETPATGRELRPFERLRSEIDRLFGDFGAAPWHPSFRTLFDIEPLWRDPVRWGRAPAVDIAETDKDYQVTAELPGIADKDVEVRYADGTLTIKGEKHDAREDTRDSYHLSERRYGAFQRSFRVPDGVDNDRIGASFKDGVLTVTLPKSADARSKERRIEIK